MDDDPLEEVAPNVKIGPSDPEHELFILQGMITRSYAAIQEFQ